MAFRERSLRIFFLLMSVSLCALKVQGQGVYSYTDENGVRVLTNIPPSHAHATSALPSSAPPPRMRTVNAAAFSAANYEPLIEKYSAQYHLDPSLVRSVIAAESAYNPAAVSPKGARGLMQLMPATASRLGVRNSFDPEDNIRGGVRHLKSLLDTFDNDLILSLAAYNAGENLVQRIGRIPNIPETHQYIRNVTKRYGKKQMTAAPGRNSDRVATMYRFTDRDGILHLTNIPPNMTARADFPLILPTSRVE
jgi:hypothetical protein